MQDDWILSSRVAPFGDLRVKGYLLLTAAYRSLSRPSSAPDAKAFPLRSFSLDLRRRKLRIARPSSPAFQLAMPVSLSPLLRLFPQKSSDF